MKVESWIVEAHIFRKTKDDLEFLLMRRSQGEKYAGVWQMVTGGINSGEEAYRTALREIKEETGFVPINFWIAPTVNSFYSPEKNSICMVPVFAALVADNVEVKISEEHDSFLWLTKEEAKELLAWQGQRDSVDLIYEYFTNRKSFLNFVEIDL